MKKLISQMTGGSTNTTLVARATAAADRIKLEQDTLITNLTRDIMECKGKLDNVLDIGPDESTSMRPTAKDFNAASFVGEVQGLRVKIVELEVQLEIAKQTMSDWSSEDEAAAPAAPARRGRRAAA